MFKILHLFRQKDTWEEVIKNRLIQHLKDPGGDNGLVRNETRYFEILFRGNYYVFLMVLAVVMRKKLFPFLKVEQLHLYKNMFVF